MKKYREVTPKHRTKAEKAQRKAIFRGLDEYPDLKEQPDWLAGDQVATAIYGYVMRETKKGDLKNIDMPLLGVFAKTYSNIVDLSRKIDNYGIVNAKGQQTSYFRAFNAEVKQLGSLADKLGISPSTRVRNAFKKAPIEKPKDKFLETMKHTQPEETAQEA